MSRYATERDAISNIQRYLRSLRSEENKRIFSVPVDGVYDSATRNAVAEFQRMYSLPATGTVDKITFDLLFAEHKRAIRASEDVSPQLFPDTPEGYTTSLGEKSFFVELLQFMLREIKLVYDTIPFFDSTGEYDSDTSLAIKELQRLSSIPVTGQVDKGTWNALVRAYNSLYYR